MTATNVVLSDCEFLTRDIGFVILFGVAFVVFQFLVSKITGVPLYPSAAWYNFHSLISALVFLIILGGIFMLLVGLTAILPRKETHVPPDSVD